MIFKRWLSIEYLTILILINVIFIHICDAADMNPYKVLGIPRNADEKHIRNAYRKLAKDWHPDKNKSPEAHEKFMQINQAYEILSDSERRSLYDEYGTTNEPRHASGGGYQRESYDSFFRDFDGFDSFFGGHGGFRFNFNNHREHTRKSPEEEINKKIYDETIFPNSHVKPFLVFTYTEFCFSCIAVDNVWQTFKQEIKNIGFGAGHSDASWNRELSKILGISTVPSIVGIINGRIHHFRGEFTLKNLRDFVRHLIPSRLVVELNQNNFNYTLHQAISDNKVFALFLSYSNQISLRYQMPCLQMVNFIKCASIKLNNIDERFKEYLKVNYRIEVPSSTSKQEMLVLFKEYMFTSPTTEILNYKPSFFEVSNEIPYATILQIFETNNHLNIPRISSSHHFYSLCPSWSQFEFDPLNPKNVFCLIIIAKSDSIKPEFLFDQSMKFKFIKKLSNEEAFKQNFHLTFIYSDVQNEFIERIIKNSKSKFTENKVLILKRLDDKYAQFDFLDEVVLDEKKLLDKLKNDAKLFLNGDKKLKYKMTIPNFYEESNQGLIDSFIDYMEHVWDYFTDRGFWERILGNGSYMMVLLCTFLFFWLMMMFSSEKSNPNVSSNYRNKREQETNNRERYREDESNNNGNESFNQSNTKLNKSQNSANTTLNDDDLNSSKHENFNINTSNQFQIVEMNVKNYSNLITELPKGYRTILLILNQENKNQLIELFTQVCLKYNNKSYRLRFAYLNKNTFTGKKWLDEMIFDKYKQIDDETGENSECESTASGETTDDYEQIDAKVSIDLKSECNVLAINNQQKYYTVFNFRFSGQNSTYINLRRKNSKSGNISLMDQSMGLEESYSEQLENKFINELCNWMDKFTEGFLSNKIYVKQWPRLD